MFTLVIDGRAIAVTDAEEEAARELFASEDFKDDLLTLESEGKPLWNGTASLEVRASSDGEADDFREALADDEDEEEDDEDPGINVVFLVPVDGGAEGEA